jgi:hypothetical protein
MLQEERTRAGSAQLDIYAFQINTEVVNPARMEVRVGSHILKHWNTVYAYRTGCQ